MNFYEYLGVDPGAGTEEIRKAFRQLAKTTHPDYNKKDSAFWDMVELNIIRDTLLNPEKRSKYDLSLKNGSEPILHSKTTTKRKPTIFSSIRSLFIYRCKTCGHEMTSTWKGYCLYHYLEATDQLYNNGFIFEYAGISYRWADPPPELKKKAEDQNIQKNSPTFRKPSSIHIALYLTLILMICGYIIVFITARLP